MNSLNDQFDIGKLEEIQEQIEYIQRMASIYHHDDPQLFGSIDHLAKVAGMFCDVIVQELKGQIEINNPQDYIESKISSSYLMMRRYSRNT